MIDLFKTRFKDLNDGEVLEKLHEDYVGIDKAEYGNSYFGEFAYILQSAKNPLLWVYYERRVNYKQWRTEAYLTCCLEGNGEEVSELFYAFNNTAEAYYENNNTVAGGN